MLHAIADFAEVANLRKALVANLNVSVSQTVASHQPVSLLTSVVPERVQWTIFHELVHILVNVNWTYCVLPDERYCIRVHSGIY